MITTAVTAPTAPIPDATRLEQAACAISTAASADPSYTAPTATLVLLADIKKASAGRRIINIGQNETARVNMRQKPHVDLLIEELSSCVGVIFKDQHGNVSATHADVGTDLRFIRLEARKMEGKYTVDVVKNTSSPNFLDNIVYQRISETLGQIPNSKGNREVRKTSTGHVLLRGDKMLIPTRDEIRDLRVKKRCAREIPKTNPLKDSFLDEGSKPIQMRYYERGVTHGYELADILPTAVYENGWTGEFATLGPETRAVVQKATSLAATDLEKSKAYLREESLKVLKKKPGFLNPMTLAQVPSNADYTIEYLRYIKAIG